MPSQLQQLEIFHRRCLRNILEVRRRDGISIEEPLRRTQQHHIGNTIRPRKAAVAGPCHADTW
jgi:hypothetical protein